jgi:hypothetical protein
MIEKYPAENDFQSIWGFVKTKTKRVRMNLPERFGGILNVRLDNDEFFSCISHARAKINMKIRRAALLMLGLYHGKVDKYWTDPKLTKDKNYVFNQNLALDVFSALRI